MDAPMQSGYRFLINCNNRQYQMSCPIVGIRIYKTIYNCFLNGSTTNEKPMRCYKSGFNSFSCTNIYFV